MSAADLQIFRNGNLDKPSDYAGPRDAAGIVSYLEKVSGPPSKELKTKEEVWTRPSVTSTIICPFTPLSAVYVCGYMQPNLYPRMLALHFANSSHAERVLHESLLWVWSMAFLKAMELAPTPLRVGLMQQHSLIRH